LRSILEDLLLDTMFELPSLKKVSEVVIDKATVETDKAPLIVYKSEKKKKSDKKAS